jgi:hypothetical protein
MKEENRLSVLEMLRKIFGFERVDVTGHWSRLYIEELCSLYS